MPPRTSCTQSVTSVAPFASACQSMPSKTKPVALGAGTPFLRALSVSDAVDPVAAAVGTLELEPHRQLAALLVDQVAGAAAAVLAEQRVGDGVEQRALAVAVLADDDGGAQVLEVERFLVAVGEKPAQGELERDHAASSSSVTSSCSTSSSSSRLSTRVRCASSWMASATNDSGGGQPRRGGCRRCGQPRTVSPTGSSLSRYMRGKIAAQVALDGQGVVFGRVVAERRLDVGPARLAVGVALRQPLHARAAVDLHPVERAGGQRQEGRILGQVGRRGRCRPARRRAPGPLRPCPCAPARRG